ncbi:hypothetical protein [Stenotrophomonas bentonitica]
MPPFPPPVATLQHLTPHRAPPNGSAAQDPASHHTPRHVGNAASPCVPATSALDLTLSPHEAAVHDAILATGAPESTALAWTMKKYLASAASPEERAAIIQCMEQALAARGHDVAVLRNLGIHALDSVLSRAAWTTLMAELPGWAGSALSAGQLARSVFTGTWSSVATVLPSLAAALPTLRTHADFDALVQSLPETVRNGLWALHESVTQADAQLRPKLGGGHLLSALAVAALLWQLRQQLPKPSGQLQGIGSFIADLPKHWQRVAVLNGVGGTLFKPVEATHGADLAAPKVKLTEEQKQARILHQHAVDRGSAVIPTWDTSVDEVELARAPGTLAEGSAIAAPPTAAAETPADAATSPAGRQRGGWLAWLGAGVAALGQAARGGFQAVPEAMPAVEMTLMGPSTLNEVTSTTPLVRVASAADAASTARLFPNLRQSLLAQATVKTVAALGAAGAALMVAKRYFWPGTPPATPAELAERLAGDVVELPSGHWGTGLDLVLGELDATSRGPRMRRAAVQATAAPVTHAGTAGAQLHGRPGTLLDALKSDTALLDRVQSMRLWSVAVARDVIASQPGWQWVATLPASEQELLVSQWQVVRELAPALAEVDAATEAAMTAALLKTGWRGPWQDIEVKLPTTQVAGIAVDDRLPLLQYCLTRDVGDRHAFLRAGTGVTADERAQLAAFVGSADARLLRGAINARMEQVRPALSRTVQARLVIDALKAKAQGVLGSGNAHRRGADIVLGFLQGTGAVERAELTYADGPNVKIVVPNYLVLRSVEQGTEGQVVLYRSDLSSFQTFGDETAFRQYLDTRRARIGAFVANGNIDATLGDDIVQAALPAQRAEVRGLVQSWEARFARYQSGQRGPQAWNPGESFQLAFARVDQPEGARQQWADALIAHGEVLGQERLQRNRLRWSPLGIANIAAETAYGQQQERVLQTLHSHAHADVTAAMVRALRTAGFAGPLEGFDPDLVRLRVGGREMDLVDWATHGWQGQGLRRPAMPANLPDWSPDAGGLPSARLEPVAWLDDDTLDAMQLVAYRRDPEGALREDAAMSGQLHDGSLRRAICTELEDFAESNRLADAYIDHLKALPHSPQGPVLAAALGDQIRARTAWMIETGRQDGTLNEARYRALQAAHAQLDPQRTRPSSLQGVTINGHAIVGLWAIRSSAGRHVFLPDTGHGDRLLDERAFAAWLRRPEAEGYIRARARMDHHESLAKAFEHTSSSHGIPFGFTQTRGPKAAAAALIDARMSDVDRMTVSQLERLGERLKMIGAISVGAACSMASGFAGTAWCVAGTLGMLADSIQRGVTEFENGNVNDGLIELGGGLYDLLDIAQIGAIPSLLYQVGKRGLETLSEARTAVRNMRLQLRGFTADGRVNEGFAVSRQSLASVGLPILKQTGPDGATVYRQGERTFIEQGGRFIEAAPDEDNVLRLRMPDAADAMGPPVQHTDNGWRRRQQQPAPRRGTTTVSPLVTRKWMSKLPEAKNLPVEKLDELEAIFGVLELGGKPTADVMNVVQDWAMAERLQEIVAHPATLGRPGEGAFILRAWADSPRLGNGRSVETFFYEIGDWMRAARFGTGPVGLHVEVPNARTLPDLEALVDAAGLAEVAGKLELPPEAAREEVLLAVRRELAGVIGEKPAQSQQTWQRWQAMQHRLPTAADNLVKHYPELTRAEAQELVASDPLLAKQAESWLFPRQTAAQVADVLANRKLREQRQSVVGGRIRSLSEVQVLQRHLQNVVPGRDWSTRSDPSGNGIMLAFGASGEGAPAGHVTFGAGDTIPAPGTVEATPPSWQHRVFEQLTAAERQAVGDPERLRKAVIDRMKQSHGAAECALPRRSGGRMARAAEDCSPLTRISLEPEDVETYEALDEGLLKLHEKMDARYAERMVMEREYKALLLKLGELKKQNLALEPADARRLSELGRFDYGLLKGFDMMNFANYQLSGLTYKGKPVDLGPGFRPAGAAASGNPRGWMGEEDFVTPNYIRRVLLPESVAGGKITQTGMFREDYAMGADLSPMVGKLAAPGQPSVQITLVDDDLLVKAPGTKGRARTVPLRDLADAEIEALGGNDVSATMRQVMGDARLLPSNARSLAAGEHYRIYSARTCSEDKILNDLFGNLGSAVAEISGALKGSSSAPIHGLAGRFYALTDMHLCVTSCLRRMRELVSFMPDLKIKVFYRFDDNKHRHEWWAEQKVQRVIQRNQQDWEAKGYTDAQMQAEAMVQLKDKQVAEWVDAELLRDPPVQPKPRLWDPKDEEEAF